MRRLDDIFTLGLDDSGEGLRNYLAVMSWGFPIRTPGEVRLTRTGTKIHRRDSALETYDSSDTRDFRRDLFVTGFRFQDDDDNTITWRPQGLSGSADASTSGLVDGRKFLLVGWYYKVRDGEDGDVWPEVDGGIWAQPMRVSLVDVTSMDDISYRHILLVQPTADGSSFEPAVGQATCWPDWFDIAPAGVVLDQIAASDYDTTCAVTAAGSRACWIYDEADNPPTQDSTFASGVSDVGPYKAVTMAGSYAACVIAADGGIACVDLHGDSALPGEPSLDNELYPK